MTWGMSAEERAEGGQNVHHDTTLCGPEEGGGDTEDGTCAVSVDLGEIAEEAHQQR
jgi:hypothetical protein